MILIIGGTGFIGQNLMGSQNFQSEKILLLYRKKNKTAQQSASNIMNITYGRGVGYKIEEEVLDEETQQISATKIREQMRKDGEL